MSLEEINKDAKERFSRLKTKMKLDLQDPLIKKGIDINKKKIQELLNAPEFIETVDLRENPRLDEAIKEIQFIDNSFNFIESLNLPPQLSLAIGLIIAGNKSKDKFEIIKVIEILNSFDHEKAWKNE